MMRRLMVLTALLVTVIAPLSLSGTFARQSANVATPADAAVFYSQLEANGSFESLYEWMHPDAQSIVPATAVVGWYTNEFAPSGPGVITVTGVTMTSWTWEVTGQTYPNTAVVSFQQPFANGTLVEDVIRLVESDGEWRWFFGRNREFVDAQIARYDDHPIMSGEACTGAAEWWAETYPRTYPTAYFSYFFPSIWNGGSASSALLQNYSDLFSDLYDAQSRSTPPPAAAKLQADLLYILETYHRATDNLEMVAGGNINPLAEIGALDAGLKGIDNAGAAQLNLGVTIDAFLLECDPIVVFVFGMGEDLPVGVLPGQVGRGIPAVSCIDFASQQKAQRFFEAAQPGDPHGLDADGDGSACSPQPQALTDESRAVMLY